MLPRCGFLVCLASPLFEIARVLVRFDHSSRFIVNANHSGVRPHPARHSGIGNVFRMDKVAGFGLSSLAATAGTRWCGEAVIKWGPAKGKHSAKSKSPFYPAP
jgi:hypothetical protein